MKFCIQRSSSLEIISKYLESEKHPIINKILITIDKNSKYSKPYDFICVFESENLIDDLFQIGQLLMIPRTKRVQAFLVGLADKLKDEIEESYNITFSNIDFKVRKKSIAYRNGRKKSTTKNPEHVFSQQLKEDYGIDIRMMK